MSYTIICLGNTGCQIAKAISSSSLLNDAKVYCIDSQTSSVDREMVHNATFIPIVSDDKVGSGRNRERGSEMYLIHEGQGEFVEMYDDAIKSKSPVIVITSSAGGTGSGSCVPLCKSLVELGIKPLPIIVCPAMEDPDAYHMNTNDLFIELADIKDSDGEPGVPTYSIFQNPKDSADYAPINNDVVTLIEIILGKRYAPTDKDSIDESDLDAILGTPGRFIAVSAKANDVNTLRKEITRKVFSSYQPAWSAEEAGKCTLMTGYSLTSMFAEADFETVFSDIRTRVLKKFDEYRNIAPLDNNGMCEANIIIAGLPRPEVKTIDDNYSSAGSLGEGIQKSKRPAFMRKKKAIARPSSAAASTPNGDHNTLKEVKWNK